MRLTKSQARALRDAVFMTSEQLLKSRRGAKDRLLTVNEAFCRRIKADREKYGPVQEALDEAFYWVRLKPAPAPVEALTLITADEKAMIDAMSALAPGETNKRYRIEDTAGGTQLTPATLRSVLNMLVDQASGPDATGVSVVSDGVTREANEVERREILDEMRAQAELTVASPVEDNIPVTKPPPKPRRKR